MKMKRIRVSTKNIFKFDQRYDFRFSEFVQNEQVVVSGNQVIEKTPCKGITHPLALTGRLNIFVCLVTQGGGEYALPWAKIPCPYRAEMWLILSKTCRFHSGHWLSPFVFSFGTIVVRIADSSSCRFSFGKRNDRNERTVSKMITNNKIPTYSPMLIGLGGTV